MGIEIDTGAWVVDPDVNPDYWHRRAIDDARLNQETTADERRRFKENNEIGQLALEAYNAFKSGKYPLPGTVTVPAGSLQ